MTYDDGGAAHSPAPIGDDWPRDGGGSASTNPPVARHVVDSALRYSERPTDWHARLAGAGGTMSVFLLLAAAAFLTWRNVYPVRAVSEPLAVSLRKLAAPDTVREIPDGPVKSEQHPADDRPGVPEMPSPLPLHDVPRNPVPLAAATEPSPPAKLTQEASAPKSIEAPPAPQASSSAQITWEAALLAHLGKYRRYPAAARARREQGTVQVRFRMNREGLLLSAEILRSSGSPALDRAALDTFRRAQPLPRIPPDRTDPAELVVPVEFFINP